jgi:hypothetical protein
MDLSSFLANLASFANDIDIGRRGLASDGEEHTGRLFYEKGIAGILDAFQEAQATRDPRTLILAELAYLQQELQFCNESDKDTQSSLIQAVQSFEDALRCLMTVEDPDGYRFAETTYPTYSKYRIQGFPRDAFHSACIAHKTRLRNSLRTPGINMIEKTVLHQRIVNMTTAQSAYAEQQKAALIDYLD